MTTNPVSVDLLATRFTRAKVQATLLRVSASPEVDELQDRFERLKRLCERASRVALRDLWKPRPRSREYRRSLVFHRLLSACRSDMNDVGRQARRTMGYAHDPEAEEG